MKDFSIAIVLNGVKNDCKITEDYVICADGGYNLIDFQPNVVIGDFDSCDKPSDVETIQYPVHKDKSDGVLCLDYAKTIGKDVVIYCANGGRMDHIIANLSLLQYAYNLGLNAFIKDKGCRIYYKTDSFTLKTEPDKTVSLISMSGCKFGQSKGLMYPLEEISLDFSDASHGISNKTTDNEISVNIIGGSVFVFLYDQP